MFIAKVVGNTWATRKHPTLVRSKLLLVRQYDVFGKKFQGKTMMAVDSGIGAGAGDIVLIMDEGSSARQIMGDPEAPVRTIVVGVVDEVQAGGVTVRCH